MTRKQQEVCAASRSAHPAAGAKLFGAEAFFNPAAEPQPEQAYLEINGQRFSRGVRVRLRPHRSVDSLDLFLAGRIARIECVERDLEHRAYVAVALEDGPAGDAYGSCGRFLYFHPDELEFVENGGAAAPGKE